MKTAHATIGRPHVTERSRALEETAGGPQPAPKLRLLKFELPKARVPFSLLCVTILIATLLAVLLLNIFISHTSYQIDQLNSEKDQLAEQKDRLVEDNSYRESPQNISIAAEELGLVRDSSPEFLDAKTGKIIDAPPIDVSGKKKPTVVPGPRADTREDLRPNLRSDEKLPVVGGSPSQDVAAPSQEAPK
ncbi:hypothetical protein ACH82I_00320 [Brevibacterium sp. GP-SGM9]|uniref:hypothetical protein n=1 Tax=unclassified Brevibacterium TaxID=2614124 RepID=UPI001E64F401|nr:MULTISPECIES: hypothetical protein [unclassified Brevibacterium]MCD1285183.1 hypothetical protein [Brevibacterium sp. CCUG 69071]MDK8435194.1 hypothetical protein [Brevibacterium sp. H-BE7]